MSQSKSAIWSSIPAECRLRHHWRPGTVTISWEACECAAAQQARGDLWDVLFDGLLTLDALVSVTAPVHVVEGSQTSAVDHAICDVVRRRVPQARHTLIEGARHMMPLTHPEPLTRALLTGLTQRYSRVL